VYIVGIQGHALGDSFFGDTTFYENLSRSFQNPGGLTNNPTYPIHENNGLQRPCQRPGRLLLPKTKVCVLWICCIFLSKQDEEWIWMFFLTPKKKKEDFFLKKIWVHN
jgi:hypothetical protein